MSQKKEVWVTTLDNPFDPFTQFDRWYKFDMDMGYNTCGKIAYLASDSNQLSDAEHENAIDFAISRLLDWYDGFDVYRLAIEGKEQKWGFSESDNFRV